MAGAGAVKRAGARPRAEAGAGAGLLPASEVLYGGTADDYTAVYSYG